MVGSRFGALRPRVASLGIALSVLGATSGFVQHAAAQTAAPSADELTAARELFQSAYEDEQAKRFAQALEKFRRVASVKESASVRYRIGSVLESLGRLRESRDAFRALAASKPNLPANEREISDSAAERAHQLDTKIPRIVLKLQENAPADARVTLDGAPVPASTTPRQLELDPGEHVVQATSPSTRPSETRVALGEGSEVTVNVAFGPPTSQVSAAPPKAPPAATTPADRGPARDRTLAYVALGGGGALLVTGLVLLGIREGDISSIEKECGSDNVCPASMRADLEGKRDQAELFGPLGVGLGLVGLAGVGIGSWLLFRPAPSSGQAVSTPTASAASVRVTPRPLVGGGMLGLSSVF
jgi:hypothetical protein